MPVVGRMNKGHDPRINALNMGPATNLIFSLVKDSKQLARAIVAIFASLPFVVIVVLVMLITGNIQSPWLSAMETMSEQNQKRFEFEDKRFQAIVSAVTDLSGKVDHNGDTMEQVVRSSEKSFNGQVANCFVAAKKGTEGWEMCKSLQRYGEIPRQNNDSRQ